MNLTCYFSLSRFLQLLKLEWSRSRKGILITFLITFGLLFTVFILESVFSYSKICNSHPSAYAFALLTAGFILSSLAFNDLGHSLRRHNYLMLPASTFEKFFSMWLLTCAGWIIAFTLVYILYSAGANALGHLFFSDRTYIAFSPVARIPVNAICYYLAIQGVFLVGAVHFRGFVFPKTILALLIFGMVCGIIFYFTMSDLFQTNPEFINEYSVLKNNALYKVWMMVRWMFRWLLAPLCWVITCLGLKEQEV
ncbi:MAG: hypothetical protein JXR41_04980 [Bacteroidales bacterium]|nr:hypothetical protein [Bacteroidales bacterium]MBN2762425.1 hypothetical protein [Bacteroidales bacterium]